MTNENIDDLRKILTAYGERHQMHMIVEECAELIKTISKINREGRGAEEIKNYIEELADVAVLMKRLFLALSPSEQAEYYKVQHYKIERQLKRIEREPVCFTVDDEIDEAFHAGLKKGIETGKKIKEAGHWAGGYDGFYECTHCKEISDWDYNFCPNCGAKMDGKDGEQNA
mgnify:CR=1 FL=1